MSLPGGTVAANPVDSSPSVSARLAPAFADAFAAFEEALLVLDADKLSLHWQSPAAARLLPALETLGVGEVLRQLDPSLPELRRRLQTKSEAMLSATLPAQGTVGRLDCKACISRQRWLLIRLGDSREQFVQMQHYMQEREKLFTTSRSISVSEMATTLAHELNQPIGTIANIIKGIQSRLDRQPESSDEIMAALDGALVQSQFAARIIARIRDFTQSRQPSRIDCEIETLLQQSVDLLDWVVDSAGVSVTFEAPTQGLLVNGDPTMLQQVFTNLIRNAVDSMRDSDAQRRHLTLSIRYLDGQGQIEIADTGHGLSPDAEKNLFVPFVTQKSRGMGVGLNICRSFVELHQGRLWLARNDSGGCSSFVVLPARY